MTKQRVLCVVGPTAVGKSDLAVDICLKYHGEVISADSMQIYRGMDIGTAKLTTAEQRGITHHLLDIVDPTSSYTVATWKDEADKTIKSLGKRHLLPVVCGGTGLYIRAITDDLQFPERPDTLQIRARWYTFLETHGPHALHEQLERVDPLSAKRLHENDVKRVIRALEVAETADKPLSEGYDWSPKTGRYDVLLIGLFMEREALYERVNRRVDRMVDLGLFAEVRKLLEAGVTPEHTALQAIGYKEVVQCLQGECSAEEAIESIKRNTRRFVKRQLSWFRRDPRIEWFERNVDGTFPPGEEDRLWRMIADYLEGKRTMPHE
ncbi:tRNA (adenosine(37)-N6)-dimethylallyltransferase MiaA [Alicyclobacillus dauci]|uniref:tRNA dimethylallyltransferase n=1 Tax=Alicyclobacillus dauci TaxID=1475485 RepID=A0ABY6YXJ5_9BACL|nr:tRNA (adenosine(37)-N6)-dimethylallyltransferase MiaA [Alicyclobacillus dauci]WAH35322.1 tRNA (adenosine(37)-N6)-dimethylallyltransferase MiaA [Alicyclobacillus dauci]